MHPTPCDYIPRTINLAGEGGELPDNGLELPVELLQEIARHNACDIPALCDIALASKALRAEALIHLFAAINLSQPKDRAIWGEMVTREPQLAASIVKEISFDRFSNRNRGGRPRNAQHYPPRPIEPPSLSQMPSVQRVTWCTELLVDQSPTAVGYLSLFPNLTELRLSAAFDHFDSLAGVLAACGSLTALYLSEMRVDRYCRMSRPYSGPAFDLTRVQKLEVQCLTSAEFIVDLITHSPPLQLKELIIGGPTGQLPCSSAVLRHILRFSAQSLEVLQVEASFCTKRDPRSPFCKYALASLRSLGSFPVLRSLKLWLDPDIGVPAVLNIINALPPCPHLVCITLRIPFLTAAGASQAEIEAEIQGFTRTIHTLSQSPLLLDAQRFLRFDTLRIDFCTTPLSYLDYTPALRRSMERFVRRETVHMTCSLETEWFSLDADVQRLSFRDDGMPSYGIRSPPPYPNPYIEYSRSFVGWSRLDELPDG
ncbi:hypothetical protein C8R47DRAFT_1198568 [Mycena vitilis]|nr:hypothetical protein C8R47DRAFT_1198568 [Mycena vitilis]